jgi:hypothetical protein
MSTGTMKGRIAAWFPLKAFGFIHSTEDGTLLRYFFHISGIVSGVPKIGNYATFDIDTARIIPGKSVLPVNNVAITPQHGAKDSVQNVVADLLSGKNSLGGAL